MSRRDYLIRVLDREEIKAKASEDTHRLREIEAQRLILEWVQREDNSEELVEVLLSSYYPG